MKSLGPNVLHQILLEQAQDAPSLKEAERNLRILHAVLCARLAKRGIAKPTEAEVYRELQRMLKEK